MNPLWSVELNNIFWIVIPVLICLFVLIYFHFIHWQKLLIPIFRSVIQLSILVLILGYVSPYASLKVAIFTCLFLLLPASIQSALSIWGIDKDSKGIASFLSYLIYSFLSLLIGSSLPVVIWFFLIFSIEESNDVALFQVWIALSGIAIITAMVSVTESGKIFIQKLNSGKNKIETALALGLTMFQSFHWLFKESVQKALTPILINMAIAGMGGIPFFMSAQILDGLNLTTALYTQLAILGGVFTASATSILLMQKFLYSENYRYFFPERYNRDKRFKPRKKIKVR